MRIRRLTTWHAPVFLVNSRLGLVSATPSGSRSKSVHPTGAPLLPKLRGQLAEFLDQGSPDRLSILYSPTCVGLRYGQRGSSLGAFLGGMGVQPLRLIRLGIAPQPLWGPDLPGPRPTRLPQVDHRLGWPTLPRPPIAGLLPGGSVGPEGLSLATRVRPGRYHAGTGISTRCPSTTPLGLALGPD